jgi:RNA polymerase sigma-70 factor (TIGR02943 family)
MSSDAALPVPGSDPDQWVDAHADSLFRYALTRLRQRADAEDAVQETLLAALQAQRTFRGDSAERTWLFGILRHKIVDRIRIAVRDGDVEALPADDIEHWQASNDHWIRPPKAWSADPATLSENAEFWQHVRACFGALPERQAQVFALRTFDGLEADEICKNIGISPTNLWVLLHRARTRLRACLESSWFAPESSP